MNTSMCPYCNAALPPVAAAPTVEKMPCPRCGELVPGARWPVDSAAEGVRAGEPPIQVAAPLSVAVDVRAGNRKTAFIILGVMLSMALIALSYALWTADLRRSRHPWMPDKEAPIARRRPAELSGLGFLPQGASLIAGLHIAEMYDDKEIGRKLLEDPRATLLDWVLRHIPRATGIEIKEIDHVVASVGVDGPLPQVVFVVKTRTPYDLERLAKSARPAKTPLYKDKPLYEVSPDPLVTGYLWCVEDQTLIYVVRLDELKTDHLRTLSATVRPMDKVLPAAVRSLLSERLPTHQFLWAAGQVDQLGDLKTLLPLDRTALAEVKAFAIGIAPLEGLTLTGNFQMGDAKTAARFQTLLDGVVLEGAKSQKVERTPADAKEQWLTWQVRGDVGVMRDLMNRGKKKL